MNHSFFTIFAALSVMSVVIDGTCFAAILYESGALGPTGVPWESISSQAVPGENVSASALNGVRFELATPVVVERIGGHFAGPSSSNQLFGALVQLDGPSDFPDSTDLSTADVRGVTLLTAVDSSSETFGDVNVHLSPGWYAVIFGSGLFGANGGGAALLNNPDIGSPDYIGYLSGFGWGHRLANKRFVVEGYPVPEPACLFLVPIICALQLRLRRADKVSPG